MDIKTFENAIRILDKKGLMFSFIDDGPGRN